MKLEGDKVLTFATGQVFFMPIVAITFPPGMLAIAAALNAVFDRCAKLYGAKLDPASVEFTIKNFREEIETWDIQVEFEDTFYDQSATFDVRVIRDRNNYGTEVKEV